MVAGLEKAIQQLRACTDLGVKERCAMVLPLIKAELTRSWSSTLLAPDACERGLGVAATTAGPDSMSAWRGQSVGWAARLGWGELGWGWGR